MSESIRIIENTLDYYNLLFADISNAKKNIRLEIYAIEPGDVADSLSDILLRKSSLGIQVSVIADSVGSFMFLRQSAHRLKNGGIDLYEFNPVLRLPKTDFSFRRFFRRDHRKLAIIDEHIYYVGGMNIGDRFLAWRDITLRGENKKIAKELAGNFDATQKGSHAKKKNRSIENSEVEVCDCRPRRDYYPVKRLYISSIKKAKKKVYIAQAYFVPRRKIIRALKRAAKNGVDVRIVIPARSDLQIVDLARMSALLRLVRHGVKVYLYEPSMLHTKMAIIDDNFITVGTANVDSMSIYWNLEINLILRGNKLVERANEIFADYLSRSTMLDIATIRNRPLLQRMASRALYSISWIL